MSEEVDDLFDDASDDPQQQEQQQPQPDGSPQEQQQQEDAGGGGLEDLEDDMGGEPDEADLFGSDDAAEPAADEQATGEPITVSAPLLQRPPAGKLLLLKVPNILKVDPLPYDPEQTDIEPELIVEGKKRVMRPNDINVIRWRYRQNEDGSVSRESNARYVEWSDGTESIVLGDEVLSLERKEQPRPNTYVHVVRYDAIQGLAHIKQSVHLKPASLDSKLHKRLKLTVHQATQKTDKVQVHLAARNPEQEKLEAERRAEDQAKLRRSQARVIERSRLPKQRVPMFTAAYIEEEEEEEPGYQEQEQEEDDYYRRGRDDEEAAARLQSAKRSTPPPTSLRSSKQARVEPPDEEQEQDAAEAEETAKAAAGLKVRRGAILDDEDDD